MSVFSEVLAGLKTAIELNSKVVTVAETVKELAAEIRDIDRRLVRVETLIEIAKPAEGAVLRIADNRRKDGES